MKLRLTLLAAAMATVSAPSFAGSALELYGKLNVTVQNTDTDAGDKWEAKSNASRLGVKGELGIDDGFSAFYQIEMEVDATEKSGSGSGADNASNNADGTLLKSRNVAVGLQGGAGKIWVGRWDTPLKLGQGKVDLFNDLDGDLKAIFSGEARANNIVSYSSPKIADGLVFNVASLFQEKVDTDASASDDDQDSMFDALSYSVEWQGKDLFVSFAQDQDHKTGAYLESAENTRLTATYKFGDFQIGALYQEYEDDLTDKVDGLLASVAWNVADNDTLKLQHGSSDIVAEGGEMTYVGWDHKLGKNILLFAFYGETTFDDETKDLTHLAGGLEVKF